VSPDALRAAIAADCPHRLDDYDRHLAGFDTRGWIVGPAFIQLWRIEHAISSQPAVEGELDRLYRQAEDSADYATAKDYLEQASSIRHKIAKGLK
jgi:hypothetical protein